MCSALRLLPGNTSFSSSTCWLRALMAGRSCCIFSVPAPSFALVCMACQADHSTCFTRASVAALDILLTLIMTLVAIISSIMSC